MALVFRFPCSSVFDDVLPGLHAVEKQLPAYWKDAGDSLSMGNTTTEIVNNDQKFSVSIDVSQFKPEDLKVNMEGRVLTIEGIHEVKDENNFMQRSFTRKWTLPEDVDLASVRSSVTEKGHLSIEAPKKTITTGRSIPIERK